MNSPSNATGGHLESPTVDDSRPAMAGWARDEIVEAAAVLLGEVHDIDFHHYGDGPVGWLHDEPTDQVAADVLVLADRLADAATTAQAAITTALGRRDWLVSGRALRCLACDQAIDPTWHDWQVCRDHAEHTWCHRDDPAAEDTDRRFTVEEAAHAAYLEDRARTGGPRTGDIVRVTYPDGTSEYALWRVAPDGTATVRTDEYHDRPLDLSTAARVEITELAEEVWTPPPDGSPVADEYFGTELTVTCGACRRPLTRPAVWARGYPLHRRCVDETSTCPATGDGGDLR